MRAEAVKRRTRETMKAIKRESRRVVSQLFRPWRAVLLQGGSPMNLVVMQPLIDVFRGDPRVRLFFSGKFRRRDDPQGLLAAAGVDGLTPLPKSEARRFRADLYVSAEGSRPAGRRSHRRALVFHGASFKGRTVARKTRFFDRILLVGPWQRRQFLARGFFEDSDPRLESVGMPKLDRLVNGSIDVAALRAKLGIAAEERVVLYAPTWGEHSSLVTMGEELIERAASLPGVRLFVKFHDHLLDPTRSEVDWRARAARWPWKNVAVWDGLDVVPALALADVLISDASSVLQEFALLDRPIVYCDVPELFDSERYKKSADAATWHQKCGPVVTRAAEIEPALRRCFEKPDEFAAARRAMVADVFYEPGRATSNAVRILYRELRLTPPGNGAAR